jgi:hypothetical protein
VTGPMTEADLLQVWDQGAARLMWQKVRAKQAAAGNSDRLELAERTLRGLPAPLAALAANRDLVQRLVGSRWYVIMLAREDGASWAEVAEALDSTPQDVIDAYTAAITVQEQYVSDLHDAARARAVLTPDAGSGADR